MPTLLSAVRGLSFQVITETLRALKELEIAFSGKRSGARCG
jgi:hypothetical protein